MQKNLAVMMGIRAWSTDYRTVDSAGRHTRASPFRVQGMLLLVVLLAGCSRDKEAIVQAKVEERVSAFRKKQLTDCYTALRRDAEHRVDSLLLAEARSALEDSLARMRPFKPVQPPAVLPIDSLSVRPIFDPMFRNPAGN